MNNMRRQMAEAALVDFKDCASRLSGFLLAKEDPTDAEQEAIAEDIVLGVSAGLNAIVQGLLCIADEIRDRGLPG